MRNNSFFVCFLLLVDGVFGFEKDVPQSVMEGDSVILRIDLTDIPKDDTIQWWFADKIIARMNRAFKIFSTTEGDAVGFSGRLELNEQNGSLTIKNTRSSDSGTYELKIKSATEISRKFRVIVSDAVKSVSVIEGDSVTLPTGVTDIQSDDQILWKFGVNVILANRLNSPVDVSWSNSHLNDQTGEITIRNIRNNQSGRYEVEIKNRDNILILHRIFSVTVGEIKHLSKTEGDSVVLHTDTEIQRVDLIRWMFGPKSTCIAEIRGLNNISLYEDVLDGKFRERLKPDPQTGSLTIINTRTTDSGLYKLEIIRSKEPKYTRFFVIVSDSRSSGSSGMCGVSFGLVVWAVAVSLLQEV